MNLVVMPGARMQIILKYQPDCFDSFSVRILADRLVRVLAAMTANPEARIGTIDVLSVLERHQLLVEWNRGSEIEGSVGNHADVFNRTSAELICARLIRVLHAMVDNPDARLTDVDVLAADEWRRLVVKWNDSATDVPDTTLLKLLEQQVVRSPDSTAVVFGDKCLTYAELDARASSIGRFFASENIGPEQIVGVHANRSLELIVALVGVLKSGAAFVLLEPTWPHQRVSEVCSRSGLITVLAGDPDAFPDIQGVSVLSIVDTEESTAAKTACATDVQRSARPEGLAYVVFTSGSTGVPKGAMIRHGAIAACHA